MSTTATIYKTTSTAPSLSLPRGLCVNTDLEHVLVCDTGNSRLSRLYLDGLTLVDNTTNATYLSSPGDVCYYDGYYYVVDLSKHVVVRFRARDMSIKDVFGTAGTPGNTTSTLNTPSAICHDREYLYVCDYQNDRIIKLNIKTLAYVAQASNINGALNGPYGICFKRDGGKALFVSDSSNNRIIKCKQDFTYIEQLASVNAVHLKTYKDMLFYCDQTNDDIRVVSSDGLSSQTNITTTAITLNNPYGIDIYKDAIFITDNGNHRITVWKVYNPRDAFTPASTAKFGGVFSDNPMWIVDEDTVTVGATDESGSPNRWKEENKNNFGFGFVKETDLTDPSWSES